MKAIFAGIILLFVVLRPTDTQGGTLVQFRTVLGTVDVELYDQEKPVTVKNFLRYLTTGAYSNVFIHRWTPGFVIQGGGFNVVQSGGTNFINAIPSLGTITNEYRVGRQFSNVYGTLAMARVSGQTNSATSEWFFNLTNSVFLDAVDGGFTVFGKVLGGTNVLNKFAYPSLTNGIFLLSLNQGSLAEVPVLSRNPTFNDLLFLDISLLNVQVSAIEGGREISWNSVSNRLNKIEYSPQMPPLWKTLISTNGTGSVIKIKDSSPEAQSRFYRVTVDY